MSNFIPIIHIKRGFPPPKNSKFNSGDTASEFPQKFQPNLETR